MENKYFTILWWFLPYISLDWPQVYMCPPTSWTPTSSLPTLSLWIVPEHWLWCPASCTELALAICFPYGNVHVSMLFSLSNHPTLAFSHWIQKSVLYIGVSDQSAFFVFSTIWTWVYRWIITALLVFCFFFLFLLPQLVSLLLIHKCVYILGFFYIGYYRVWSKFHCVIQWVLVIYFINSVGHILVWSYSLLHAPHLYIFVTGNF